MDIDTKATTAVAVLGMAVAFGIVFAARAAADDTLRLGAVHSQHSLNMEYIAQRRLRWAQVEQDQFDQFVKRHGFTPETKGYQYHDGSLRTNSDLLRDNAEQ